jgi:hypothetical protein
LAALTRAVAVAPPPLRLRQEPELLRADGDRVRRQMQELAVGQYRAFITSAECTTAVREQVAGMRQHLEALQQARAARATPSHGEGCAAPLHCRPVAVRA